MRPRSSGYETRAKHPRIVVAVMAFALTVLGALSAQAAPGVNESFIVPGEVPAAFACYGSKCVEVQGVKDVTINVAASGAVVDPTAIGTTGANCQKVDKTLKVSLAAGASGVISLSYTKVDPATGAGTNGSRSIVFSASESGPSTETISLCVR
jgi:hypothetical protein